jgi:hypothetical protein
LLIDKSREYLKFTHELIRWRLRFMRRMIFVAVVCAFVAVPAFADIYNVGSTSQVRYTGVSGGTINISGTWHTGGVYAGSYNLVVDGVSMQSFCIDLQDNSTTATVTYGVRALANAPDTTFGPMGAAKATALAELLYENWVPGMSNAALLSLQVAVWEVVADGPGNLNLAAGSFIASNAGAAAYLATINGGFAPTSLFVGLSSPIVDGGSPQYQDYVVRVPLPGALLLGFLGLGAAGLRLRRFA